MESLEYVFAGMGVRFILLKPVDYYNMEAIRDSIACTEENSSPLFDIVTMTNLRRAGLENA